MLAFEQDTQSQDNGNVTSSESCELNENKNKKKRRGGDTCADPCSVWYPGAWPFQAPEVNNMANYFGRLPRLHAYLDLRSYGQMRML